MVTFLVVLVIILVLMLIFTFAVIHNLNTEVETLQKKIVHLKKFIKGPFDKHA